MDNSKRDKINLKPVYTFLTEVTTPRDLARYIDELLFDYMIVLTRLQLSEDVDKTIHEETDQFLYFLKRFRDTLGYCEIQNN